MGVCTVFWVPYLLSLRLAPSLGEVVVFQDLKPSAAVWGAQTGQLSCKSCFLPVSSLFGSLISSLCLSSVPPIRPPPPLFCSLLRSQWYEHISHSLSFSLSLPFPHSLKIAALLNRLSLSFICHSPHCAPHSRPVCVCFFYFIYSLFQRTHHTGFCIRQCIAQHTCLGTLFPTIFSLVQ